MGRNAEAGSVLSGASDGLRRAADKTSFSPFSPQPPLLVAAVADDLKRGGR